jgi:serine/threonine protein kinase
MIDTPDESLYRTMRKEGKKSIHRERILAYSTVGTPDYIAPEVLSQKVSDGCATGVVWVTFVRLSTIQPQPPCQAGAFTSCRHCAVIDDTQFCRLLCPQ